MKRRFAAAFLTRSRNDWASAAVGTDSCVTPVLSTTEAPLHPANVERAVFSRGDGGSYLPGLAPRFSRSNPAVPKPANTRARGTRGLGSPPHGHRHPTRPRSFDELTQLAVDVLVPGQLVQRPPQRASGYTCARRHPRYSLLFSVRRLRVASKGVSSGRGNH